MPFSWEKLPQNCGRSNDIGATTAATRPVDALVDRQSDDFRSENQPRVGAGASVSG
jgi:hypothetical protein